MILIIITMLESNTKKEVNLGLYLLFFTTRGREESDLDKSSRSRDKTLKAQRVLPWPPPDERMTLLIRPDCSDHLPSPFLLEEPAVELIFLPSLLTGYPDGSVVKNPPATHESQELRV